MGFARTDVSVGSDRFFHLARLGEGGNGVVDRALDMVLGVEVAVKVLSRAGGRDLFRFKREFRALSELVHPNLVRLYELFVEGDRWFFSMELIDGVSLRDHLRAGGSEPTSSPFIDEQTGEVTAPGRGQAVPGDRGLLGDVFCQLAEAVAAIHEIGKIHRDLKPTNVQVERGGRVVVLDYGLVSDTALDDTEHTHEALAAVGTVPYMSPEQALNLPLTPATDWYSVGAMLYEALVGVRPFEGPALESLRRRTQEDPRRPRELAPEVPADLDRLCMALLHRDPAARADGDAILRGFGRVRSAASLSAERVTAPTRFVGRSRELDVLRGALAQARTGASVFMPITGPSGIGKTSLVRHFVDALDPRDTLVLRGRCYERERVPYQAIDSLLDAATSWLLRLPPAAIERVLPRDIAALARLFPTLHRVPAIAALARLASLPPDQAEVRRRAVTGLGDLLGALAGPRTLVVFLDDLQWSDPDAGAILAELVRRFEDAGALFVVASRSGERGWLPEALVTDRGTPTVRLSSSTEPAAPSLLLVQELAIGPMPLPDAVALVEAVAGGGAAHRRAAAIAEEAGGNPFFLAELARSGDGAEDALSTVDSVIERRVGRLAAEARALLEVCAVAARPLSLELAAVVVGGDVAASLTVLRAVRLVRVDRRGAGSSIEPYHDRIRAAVVASLPPDAQRGLHARLAEALERRSDATAADLVEHWLAAEQPGRAAGHARVAARHAEDALAFHRAVELYQIALGDPALTADARRILLRRKAECLANVGRLDAAIAAVTEASADARGSEQRELKRLEIELVLRVGDHAHGLAEARALCGELGIRIPIGHAATIASILSHTLRARWRRLEFAPRPAEAASPGQLERIDTLWSLTSGLAYLDPAFGRLVQLHHLASALDCGEPLRAARAICIEIPHLAQAGSAAERKVAAVTERAGALVESLGRPDLHGLFAACCGVGAAIAGRWRDAAALNCEAERLLREHCTGMRWTLNMAQFYRVAASWFLGDTQEVVRLVPRYLAEAEELGDAHALAGLRTGRGNVYWLIVDRPHDARAMAEAGWRRREVASRFLLHDYFRAIADVQIDLYLGDPARAQARIDEMWLRFGGSLLRRVQILRIEAHTLRARCAIAAAGRADRTRFLGVARASADKITAEGARWARPVVGLLRAGIAGLRDDAAAARLALHEAVTTADEDGLALFGQVARYRLGELEGGDDGRAQVVGVVDWFRAQRVVNPEALVRMLAPMPGR